MLSLGAGWDKYHQGECLRRVFTLEPQYRLRGDLLEHHRYRDIHPENLLEIRDHAALVDGGLGYGTQGGLMRDLERREARKPGIVDHSLEFEEVIPSSGSGVYALSIVVMKRYFDRMSFGYLNFCTGAFTGTHS